MPRTTVDALDSYLGTTSQRGDIVRVRDGVHTNAANEWDLPDAPFDALSPVTVDVCSPTRHAHLRGDARCLGCGRTRNEIEVDGE